MKTTTFLRRLLATGLTTALLLATTACGGTSMTHADHSGVVPSDVPASAAPADSATAGSDQSAAAKTGELEDFTVVLDWYPNAIHSFIYTAIDQGYFAEEGLNVKIHFPANPNDAITMPAAGKADLGLYYPHDIITAVANEGIPLKVVGTVSQDPLNVIISMKDSNIKGPDDLIGKTVGFPGSPISEQFTRRMTCSDGKELGDRVEILDVGFDLMTSLTTGQVQAICGAMVNHEVPVLQEKGFDIDYFAPTDFGIPTYYEMVLVTGEKQVADHSDRFSRFLRAAKRGFDKVKEDPEAAIDDLLKHQEADSFPLSKGVEMKSIKILLGAMEKPDAPFLSQKTEVWQSCVDWLYKGGLIKKKVDPKDILVDLGEK